MTVIFNTERKQSSLASSTVMFPYGPSEPFRLGKVRLKKLLLFVSQFSCNVQLEFQKTSRKIISKTEPTTANSIKVDQLAVQKRSRPAKAFEDKGDDKDEILSHK